MPNVLVKEEVSFNLVHIDHWNAFKEVELLAYQFELTLDDSNTYESSDMSFVHNNDVIIIPLSEVFLNSQFEEGINDFSLKLIMNAALEPIEIDGQFIFTSCYSILNGDIDTKNCRFSGYILIPAFGEPNPPICM